MATKIDSNTNTGTNTDTVIDANTGTSTTIMVGNGTATVNRKGTDNTIGTDIDTSVGSLTL
jgi:hypothetical protein